MKASELIAELTKLIEENGDFSIAVKDYVEGNDWQANKVLVEPKKEFGWKKNDATGLFDIHVIEDSFVLN
jgi:hypothetical protein